MLESYGTLCLKNEVCCCCSALWHLPPFQLPIISWGKGYIPCHLLSFSQMQPQCPQDTFPEQTYPWLAKQSHTCHTGDCPPVRVSWLRKQCGVSALNGYTHLFLNKQHGYWSVFFFLFGKTDRFCWFPVHSHPSNRSREGGSWGEGSSDPLWQDRRLSIVPSNSGRWEASSRWRSGESSFHRPKITLDDFLILREQLSYSK